MAGVGRAIVIIYLVAVLAVVYAPRKPGVVYFNSEEDDPDPVHYDENDPKNNIRVEQPPERNPEIFLQKHREEMERVARFPIGGIDSDSPKFTCSWAVQKDRGDGSATFVSNMLKRHRHDPPNEWTQDDYGTWQPPSRCLKFYAEAAAEEKAREEALKKEL